MNKNSHKSLINISKKTFIQVAALLLGLMILSIVLTYIIPKGEFGKFEDGSTDYSVYIQSEGKKGINIFKGIFAPVLVFGSSDGITLIMLSLFLLIISASFQVMNDVGGISALIGSIERKFKDKQNLLIALLSLVFMAFGAFLGLFEEMIPMLPIIMALSIMLGLDSFTAFLICIISCGFGFASAVTNPFTVILASEIIGVNPMHNIWYRLIIFAVMYLLLIGFIFLYVKKIRKAPEKSLTYDHDMELRSKISAEAEVTENAGGAAKTRLIYTVFLLLSLILIIIFSSISALRSYTVVGLIAYFLIFGIISGIAACGNAKKVFKSFAKGLTGALPTIVFIGLAASIKYIFDEGGILPTIANQINNAAAGGNKFVIALIIYLIVLVLEFFISSSTAKAILVMGLLAVVNVGLSKEMMVLLYTFGDGYTNVIFPTSPVLLISLSMIGMDYFKWIKKSFPLILVNTALVVLFIVAGVAMGY